MRERERMAKRYVTSKRHTIQVDFEPYMRALRARAARRSPRRTRLEVDGREVRRRAASR